MIKTNAFYASKHGDHFQNLLRYFTKHIKNFGKGTQ